MSFAYRMGRATVCKIVPETCQAIWKAMSSQFVPAPKLEHWKAISDDFSTFWNFPNCLGAIDGKHIVIRAPGNSGSNYFNYKGTFSIVLMAVSDARYNFSLFDIGAFGRQSDGGVLTNSVFGKVLEEKKMNFPSPCTLPGTDVIVPHVLVGDEAFPLREDLMRPFPGRALSEDKKIFNYRLSRARRIIENTFGILAARWQLFLSPIACKPENVVQFTKAAICLHNFLRSSDIARQPAQRYCPPGFTDHESDNGDMIRGTWRDEVGQNMSLQPVGRVGSNNHGVCALSVREDFKRYFNTIGAVPWQLKHVRRGQHPDNAWACSSIAI